MHDEHGCNGTFLASLAALSCVAITSREKDCLSCNTLVLKSSQVKLRLLSSSDSQTMLHNASGSRVDVKNLFAGMPVRQKRLQNECQHDEHERDWDALINSIVGILLAWRHVVAVSLINRETETKLLLGKRADISKSSRSSNCNHLQPAVWSPEFSSILLNQLLHRSNKRSCSWSLVSASNTYTKVRGLLSNVPAAHRKIQYISVGIRPLLPDSMGCKIYEEVNRLFADSIFGDKAIDVVVDKGELERRSRDRRFKQDGFTRKQHATVSKGVNRWPMFSLRIEPCSNHERYHTPFHDDHLPATMTMLKAMITQWLIEHRFKKQPVHKEQQASTSKTTLTSLYTLQDRGQSVKHLSKVRTGDGANARGIVSSAIRPRSSDAGLPSLRPQLLDETKLADENILSDCDVWMDPMTKHFACINKRTGMPYVARSEACPLEKNSTMNNVNCASLRPRSASILLSKRAASSSVSVKGSHAWVHRLAADWNKSVFLKTEPSIKTFGLQKLQELPVCSGKSTSGFNNQSRQDNLSEKHLRLSRTSLRRAGVVSQVDKKFILVKVPSIVDLATLDTATDLLVLIDQHAADERCIVESLYCDTCTPSLVLEGGLGTNHVLLAKPIEAPITDREGAILKRLTKRFLKYKIEYEVIVKSQVPKSNSGGLQVRVKSLPRAIVERCTADPKLIIDILRTEANLEKEYGPFGEQRDNTAVEVHTWTRNIGDCPQGIIELLNSRACRSAIMFNDELSAEACLSLITRLSQCALPFQCAHGRPSMVPLVDLSKMSFSTPFDSMEDLGTALKRWKPQLLSKCEANVTME